MKKLIVLALLLFFLLVPSVKAIEGSSGSAIMNVSIYEVAVAPEGGLLPVYPLKLILELPKDICCVEYLPQKITYSISFGPAQPVTLTIEENVFQNGVVEYYNAFPITLLEDYNGSYIGSFSPPKQRGNYSFAIFVTVQRTQDLYSVSEDFFVLSFSDKIKRKAIVVGEPWKSWLPFLIFGIGCVLVRKHIQKKNVKLRRAGDFWTKGLFLVALFSFAWVGYIWFL